MNYHLGQTSDLNKKKLPTNVGWGGAGSREPSRPRPDPRPELVSGPGATSQAVRGLWGPGLVHRSVFGRCCFHSSWSTTSG